MSGMKDQLDDLFSYPFRPGFKAHGTSEEAAHRIAPIAGTIRANALELITQHHPHGISADTIAAKLGKSVLAVRPRVSELHKQGWIKPTDDRATNTSGMSAATWMLKEAL